MSETDHDTLIALKATVEQRFDAIEAKLDELKDDLKTRVDDHESRIRFLEKYVWLAVGAIGIIDTIIGFYLLYKHG